MNSKKRTLMLCRTGVKGDSPILRLGGKWMKSFGFVPGDEVLVSNPAPNTLLMTVHKTAAEKETERNEKDCSNKGSYELSDDAKFTFLTGSSINHKINSKQ